MTSLDLCRSVPFSLTRAADDEPDDGLTLEGYAAVFGERTEINSWEGAFGETVRRGAFRKTIRENTPVLQFDHGRHPLIGSIPIGRIEELHEDEQGLYVRARLTDNWLIQPVRDAIADEAIDGMSFRFTVVREEWRDAQGKLVKPDELMRLLWDAGDRGPLERTLIEVRAHELGPVVFPAYAATSVGVRARDFAANLSQDPELTRRTRAALAAGIPLELEDEALRSEVARAVLFTRELPHDLPPHEREVRAEDAPPTGHPTSATDAPPTTGHPSPPSDSASRAEYARRAYVTREGVGRRFT